MHRDVLNHAFFAHLYIQQGELVLNHPSRSTDCESTTIISDCGQHCWNCRFMYPTEPILDCS